MGVVILHFFVYVHAVYLSFVLLALNCACLSALQYYLGYACKHSKVLYNPCHAL